MSDTPGFAETPKPPYYAVIFTSRRNSDDEPGYADAAQRLAELAAQQPGYLGVESVRGADGVGITVSYWDGGGDPRWRAQVEHAATRELGRKYCTTHECASPRSSAPMAGVATRFAERASVWVVFSRFG